MRIFIVTSVYQFMNAITVQLNDPSVKSDLLCAMQLLDSTFDLEKLREEKIFEDVYVWTGEIDNFHLTTRNKSEGVKNALKKVGLALSKKKLLKDFPKIEKHYDEICIGYPDFPTRLACQTLKSKDTVRTLLEEGMYTYDFLARKESFLKRTAFKLFIGEEVVSKSKKVYVYRPDMLRLGVQEMEVVKIRPELNALNPIIRKIYKNSFPQIEDIDKPVIMFDQYLENSIITENQCKMANILTEAFGQDNFVVKMHPHTTVIPYNEKVPAYTAKCPFEILMSAIDIENKILVSTISTAAMNPKMILDAEPTVIFTVKFVGYEKTEEEMNELMAIVDRLKAIYRNPEKIIVPSSMEEFEQAVNTLKENIK
ncbi:MAG: hypothetical protein J6C23_02275 [Clostridia bacterium]|nr:hypothetical protein [Clostridia bacterium]